MIVLRHVGCVWTHQNRDPHEGAFRVRPDAPYSYGVQQNLARSVRSTGRD